MEGSSVLVTAILHPHSARAYSPPPSRSMALVPLHQTPSQLSQDVPLPFLRLVLLPILLPSQPPHPQASAALNAQPQCATPASTAAAAAACAAFSAALLSLWRGTLQAYVCQALCDLRIRQLFDIIVDYPDR